MHVIQVAKKKGLARYQEGSTPNSPTYITYMYGYGLTTDIMFQTHVFIFSALSIQLSNVIYYH
jgi:hypothetical protein